MKLRQIEPGGIRYRLAQLLLGLLYGPSPDKHAGWHFYPVPQMSIGAFVVCFYHEPKTGWLVGLTERAGAVENTGLYSVTFGGYMNVSQHEQPAAVACREAQEETGGSLQLTPDRLTLLTVTGSFNELKHWHRENNTLAIGYLAQLTAAEYAAIEGTQSDEVAALRFVPVEQALAMKEQIAYAHEYQAISVALSRLLNHQ